MNIIDNFIKAINEGHYPTVLESYADTAHKAWMPQIPGVFYLTINESKAARKMLAKYLGKNDTEKENINTLLSISHGT